MGLAYPIEGITQLIQVVPPAFAKEMAFTARKVTADEALTQGLINRLVSPDDLAGTIEDLCATIAVNAPLSIKATKRAINVLGGHASPEELKELQALSDACFDSQDYEEGQRAFKEKRNPKFQGV